jgi:CO/xanthine dehydrogenase FAD-binding subunit
MLVSDDEMLFAGEMTEEKAKEFGNYVAEKLVFGSNMRGSADYRRQITPVLVKRAIMKAGKEQ